MTKLLFFVGDLYGWKVPIAPFSLSAMHLVFAILVLPGITYITGLTCACKLFFLIMVYTYLPTYLPSSAPIGFLCLVVRAIHPCGCCKAFLDISVTLPISLIHTR